jgi:hypothetical protein
MQSSPGVATALEMFFAKNASGDVSTFEEVVSSAEVVLAIGSSAGSGSPARPRPAARTAWREC